MIYLYHGTDTEFEIHHGTDTEFEIPLPEMGRRGTDFGQGFYLAPHFDSAVNMAHRVARRKNSQESVVMSYSLDENQLVSAGLRIRSFLNIEPDCVCRASSRCSIRFIRLRQSRCSRELR